jgi:hypothetical protein
VWGECCLHYNVKHCILNQTTAQCWCYCVIVFRKALSVRHLCAAASPEWLQLTAFACMWLSAVVQQASRSAGKRARTAADGLAAQMSNGLELDAAGSADTQLNPANPSTAAQQPPVARRYIRVHTMSRHALKVSWHCVQNHSHAVLILWCHHSTVRTRANNMICHVHCWQELDAEQGRELLRQWLAAAAAPPASASTPADGATSRAITYTVVGRKRPACSQLQGGEPAEQQQQHARLVGAGASSTEVTDATASAADVLGELCQVVDIHAVNAATALEEGVDAAGQQEQHASKRARGARTTSTATPPPPVQPQAVVPLESGAETEAALKAFFMPMVRASCMLL